MNGLLQLISICRQQEIFHFITFQFGVFWFWVLHIRLWNIKPWLYDNVPLDNSHCNLAFFHEQKLLKPQNKPMLRFPRSSLHGFRHILYFLSPLVSHYEISNRSGSFFPGESRGLDKESTWYCHMINCMLAAILISSWCFWCFVISYYIWY